MILLPWNIPSVLKTRAMVDLLDCQVDSLVDFALSCVQWMVKVGSCLLSSSPYV